MSWRETHCFRSRVMQLWESLLEKVAPGDWSLRYKGSSLDFTTKAKQDLAAGFERLMVLQEVRRQDESDSRVFIIDSPEFQYLKKLDPSASFLEYPSRPVLSAINVALGCLFLYAYNVVHLSLLLLVFLYSSLHRDRRSSLSKGSIKYIWHAANPNEMTLDPERRYFPWIVDDVHVSKQDVLFILPSGTDKKSRPDLYSTEYQIFSPGELYRAIPVKVLLGCAWDLFLYLTKYTLALPGGLAPVHMGDYFARVMRLKCIADHLTPRCYIISVSQIGHENPAIVYFDSTGIETVMYTYSANCIHPFGNETCNCDFRNRLFANIISSHVVVWHKGIREYLCQHPQQKTQITVVGPLMAGDESVFAVPPTVLRSKAGITPGIKSDSLKYISFFDVLTPGPAHTLEVGKLPDIFDTEYATAFLQDMVRLLDDFDDVVLVFKPKRNLQNPLMEYTDQYYAQVNRLESSDRSFIVDDDVNPWIPVAIADLCVAMPFTSPAIAAMHYGIPTIYHDPMGLEGHHMYKSISHYISHDYFQLKSKVNDIVLNYPPCYNQKREVMWEMAHEFIGTCPGTNSSVRFRKFLGNLGNGKERP